MVKELILTLPDWVLILSTFIVMMLLFLFGSLIVIAFNQNRHIKLFGFEIGVNTHKISVKGSEKSSTEESSEYLSLLNDISFLLNIKKNIQPFRKEIIKRVLTITHNEINRIISGSTYEIDIGLESNFLLRAKPLFENADKIYAITLNTVSNFWVDKGTKALAREYLCSQPQNTKRLFVFDNVKNFQLYTDILSEHYAQYGYKGSIFITNFSSYSKLLESVLSSEELHLQYQKKDFGLLHYKDHWLLAELDSNHLTFEPVPELASFRLDAEKMISLFEKFSNSDNDFTIIDNLSIIQWTPAINKTNAELFLFAEK